MLEIKDESIQNKIKFILIIILVSLIGVIPGIINGPHYLNDLSFHIKRIEEINHNMSLGIFLPCLQGNNMYGFGYLVDVFYPSAFLYIAAIFNFIFDAGTSLHIMLFIINIFTFLVSYYSVKNEGESFALCFSTIYLLLPYRLINLYLSGFLGEYLTYIFLPLVVFGMKKLFKEENWYWLAIGMIGILYSHLITLLLCSIYVFLYCLVNIKELNVKIILNLLKATITTILIGLGFLLPFIDIYTSDVFKLNLITGFIIPYGEISIPTSVKILVQIIIICVLILIYKRFNKGKAVLIYLLSSTYVLIMSTCLFPWELIDNIPILNSLQCSRRIINLIIPIVVYLITLFIVKVKLLNKIIIYLLILFSIMVGIANFQLTRAYKVNDNAMNHENYIEGTFFNVVAGEYAPLSFSIEGKFINDITTLDILNNNYPHFSEDTSYTFEKVNSLKTKVVLETEKPIDVLMPLIYYKNYKAYLNDVPIFIKEKDGLVYLENLSSGELIINYEISNLQKVSALISISCSIIFFVYLQQRRHKL